MPQIKKSFVLVVTTISLSLHLILTSLPGFKVDVEAWLAWAIRLNDLGLLKFYSQQVWTNYTPGYLYILRVLGFINGLFNLPGDIFYFLLKLPAIISEIILGLLVYSEVKKTSKSFAPATLILLLLNPAFIFNSSVWGQIDGVLTLLMYLSVYFLKKHQLIFSSVLLGLSILIKPQALALVPIFGLFAIKNFSPKSLAKLTLPAVATMFLLSLPFFINRPITGFLELISHMSGDYPYTSLFAFNLWGGVGFWLSDLQKFGPLTYQQIGLLLFVIYWIIILLVYFKKGIGIYSLAALACLSFYFLPTRVHERYLYPALVFILLSASEIKNKWLLLMQAILSLTYTLNLYFVYVYYNEFFYKLPQVLYNPILYPLLNDHGKAFSVLSTTIFVIISIVIITGNAHKEAD